MRIGCKGCVRRMIGLATGFAALLASSAARAQASGAPAVEVASTMQMTIVGTSLQGADGTVYVNQNCEIFPGLVFPLSGRKLPESRWISDVCHLESVLDSEHREEKPAGNELERSDVEVREQEYVLQNITMKPQVFAVLEQVPRGWKVDSDPQPTTMAGDIAVFDVHAEPGETVRLHVGLRHTKELKAKALPATTGP
jgi:hypothetical protein